MVESTPGFAEGDGDTVGVGVPEADVGAGEGVALGDCPGAGVSLEAGVGLAPIATLPTDGDSTAVGAG